MTALSKDRNTPARSGEEFVHPVAADAVIFAGALVVSDATGYLAPGSTAATLTVAGRAEEAVDNTGGADGALTCRVRKGVFLFVNLAADAVGQANVGTTCYIVDDQTVAATNGTNTRSAAGTVMALEGTTGVWVKIA